MGVTLCLELQGTPLAASQWFLPQTAASLHARMSLQPDKHCQGRPGCKAWTSGAAYAVKMCVRTWSSVVLRPKFAEGNHALGPWLCCKILLESLAGQPASG